MKDIHIGAPAVPDDVPQIESVFYKTWLQTYPSPQLGITTDDVEALFKDMATRITERAEYLSKLPKNELFLVAKKGEEVIGLCRVIIREHFNQLQSIYVLPGYQGLGIGTALWKEASRFLDPKKETIVHVAIYNEPAIAFYKKLGFNDTGKRFTEERHRMPVSKVLIPEMELRLPAGV